MTPPLRSLWLPLAAIAGLLATAAFTNPHDADRGQATYTVTVQTSQLVQLLKGQIFTDSGRFYPCRANPSCSAWGQDISLSRPQVTIDGPRLAFSVHLLGSYAMNQFFTARVAGDLVVSGVPAVRNNKVTLSEVQASSTPTSDLAFRTFVEATHDRIESMLEESGGFDLAQYLAYASTDPQAPPPRLPVQCPDPQQIHVQSVATQPPVSSVASVVAVGDACGVNR
jgi:hypothetical protein